ncbi:MAG: metal ABC transporter permease [Bacteroidia bacterium]|nr:metal ABC transporter permease [Bacteroidia bacterium]
MNTFWIILTGSLVAVSCALVGSFLLLRKMTLIGDAISHAVLPGIVLAYLISGSRSPLVMLAGAAATGVLVTVLIEWLHRRARLAADASIGLSFTFLFAVGVILISLFAGQVDLDQECVLYGEIAYVPLDTWTVGEMNLGPRPVWILGGLTLVIGLFVWLAYKPLLVTSFDPAYAVSVGIATGVWHYALMSLISLTTVLSFESVGAILVIAFLVGPPAAAWLLADRLPVMLAWAAGLGVLAAVGGYGLALAVDGSIAGAMAVVIGLEFLAALGISRWRKQSPVPDPLVPAEA